MIAARPLCCRYTSSSRVPNVHQRHQPAHFRALRPGLRDGVGRNAALLRRVLRADRTSAALSGAGRARGLGDRSGAERVRRRRAGWAAARGPGRRPLGAAAGAPRRDSGPAGGRRRGADDQQRASAVRAAPAPDRRLRGLHDGGHGAGDPPHSPGDTRPAAGDLRRRRERGPHPHTGRDQRGACVGAGHGGLLRVRPARAGRRRPGATAARRGAKRAGAGRGASGDGTPFAAPDGRHGARGRRVRGLPPVLAAARRAPGRAGSRPALHNLRPRDHRHAGADRAAARPLEHPAHADAGRHAASGRTRAAGAGRATRRRGRAYSSPAKRPSGHPKSARSASFVPRRTRRDCGRSRGCRG